MMKLTPELWKMLTRDERHWVEMAPYLSRMANLEVVIVIGKERYDEAQKSLHAKSR